MKENPREPMTRRQFLVRGGAILSAAALGGGATVLLNRVVKADSDKDESDEDIAPPEDLMREHGVLNRALLIYDESIKRLESGADLPPEALSGTAEIIRRFIEGYHEKLEEEFVFPRFEKKGKLVELVSVLRQQHQAGRGLTARILAKAEPSGLKDVSARRDLADTLRQFVRMYRPHEAREDTVLFPAFRSVVSKNEFDALGEDFEKKEHELFGKDGFFGIVDQVAELEKELGIYELAQFTPRT